MFVANTKYKILTIKKNLFTNGLLALAAFNNIP
ncbi:MAG: hypothetical protein JWP78_3110 [Mucilaginibacter sp.]|nr:hypothetical protein [Mucilaginibacter sp.]